MDQGSHRQPRCWLLFLGLFAFFGLTSHGYLENTDADVAMHSAHSILLRGNPGLLREGPDTTAAERYIADRIHRESSSGGGMGRVGTQDRAYTFGSIGYQVVLVPFVLFGKICGVLWPEPEDKFETIHTPVFGELFWARFWISFLPALAAAGSTLVLLRISRTLGATPREAWIATATTVLCTQFWPGASETMADGLGGFFLLACILRTLQYTTDPYVGAARSLIPAGLYGGLAVLIRYPHAAVLVVIGVWLAAMAWRSRGRPDHALLFVLGGLPCALLLAIFNLWCFDSPLETGYAGVTAAWWSYPLYLGIPLILLAPGKGVLWFSLPIVFAAATAITRRLRHPALALSTAAFTVVLVVYGRSHGWNAGQCWGVRYVTPTVALLTITGLTLGKPWQRRGIVFWPACALALAISVGGVLTPYRGHQYLAHIAAEKHYQDDLDRGAFGIELLIDRINVLPRFSPIHTHWVYAWESIHGRLGADSIADNMADVFGIPGPPRQPVQWFPREDVHLRHIWIPFLHDLIGLRMWRWLTVWGAITVTLLSVGIFRWTRSERALDDAV